MSMRLLYTALFTVAFSFFGVPNAMARSLVLTDDDATYLATTSAYLLVDPEASLTIEDIATSPYRDLFEPVSEPRLNFGFTTSSYWLRLVVENRQSQSGDWYLQFDYALLDDVRLYTLRERERYAVQRSGDNVPLSLRPMRTNRATFPIDLPVGRSTTLYLRVQTLSSSQISLEVLEKRALLETERTTQLLDGIFFGIIAGLFIYSLFYVFTVREAVHVLYLGYLAAIFMFFFSLMGLADEHFWPEQTTWDDQAVLVFAGLSCVMGLSYTKRFLGIQQATPRLGRVVDMLIGLSVVSASTPFYLHYQLANAIVSAVAFFYSLVILALGTYYCCFQGYRQARYFLMAWVVFLMGVAVFLLKQHAILPTNWLTANCIGLGLLLQVVLLSLAQADTLNSLKNEVSKLLEEKSRELTEVQEELKEKYAKSRLDDETLDRYADKLIDYMEREAPYLDGNLTLASLANAMSIQQSYLSQVLNIRLDKNFHLFVNEYRLRYVKKQLERPENRSKSILDLAYQAGFNSKSSFNTAFKKQESITPSEFRDQRASRRVS